MSTSTSAATATPPDSADATLAAVETALLSKRRAEAAILALATDWADLHPAESISTVTGAPPLPGGETARRLGGEGTPEVAEFAPAELAVSLEQHPAAARHLMADALDLRHRLPGLWHLATHELVLECWVVRKIARATLPVTQRQANEIDDRLVAVAADLPPGRLLTLTDAMVLACDTAAEGAARERELSRRFVRVNQSTEHGTKGLWAKLDAPDAIRLDAQIDRLARLLADEAQPDETLEVRRSRALGILANPLEALHLIAAREPTALAADASGELIDLVRDLDPDSFAPKTVLYLHQTRAEFEAGSRDGITRCHPSGRDNGVPITHAHAAELLGHSRVTIRPVIDLADQRPADAYEYTGTLREAVFLARPADVFPYAVNTSRAMQIDHTEPFRPDGAPGQTSLANAGPMTAHHHRIATHGRWRRRQPVPGRVVWVTPHGRYRVTDATGTHLLDPVLGSLLFDGSAMEQRMIGTVLSGPP